MDHGTLLIEPGESLQFDLNSLIICPEFAVPDPRAVTSTGYKRCLMRCFSRLTVKSRAEMADRFPVLFPDTGNPWQRRFSRRLHPPPLNSVMYGKHLRWCARSSRSTCHRCPGCALRFSRLSETPFPKLLTASWKGIQRLRWPMLGRPRLYLVRFSERIWP